LRRVIAGPLSNVFWRVLEDEAAVRRGEADPVEDKRMEELTASDGHQQPAAKPPRPRFEPPFVLEVVIQELKRSREDINGDSDAGLICGRDTEKESRETGTYSWGQLRSECSCDAWVPTAKRSGIVGAEAFAES